MIYLFDDNDYQQMSKNYSIDFIVELEKYIDVIVHIDSMQKVESLDDLFIEAKLICIHDSFPTPDDKARIVAVAILKNIPLVVFSGGADFTITKFDEQNQNYIRAIKKDRFYHNLIGFTMNYRADNLINLNKLVFGNNYEIERINVIKDRLGKNIFLAMNNFNYYNLFESKSQNYKDLWELFYFAFKESAYDQFDDFENNIEKKSSKDVYSAINSIIKKAICNYDK
jgi:hypothetical protein